MVLGKLKYMLLLYVNDKYKENFAIIVIKRIKGGHLYRLATRPADILKRI